MAKKNKIGDRIRAYREELGLTQKKLAEELGVSRPVISEIEKGQRSVRAEEIQELSKILNVPVGELLGEREPDEVHLKPEQSNNQEKQTSQGRILVERPNVEKFKEILLYILNEVGSKANVGQTVLYKLLYFIEFNYYEKFGEQLIGATFQKNHHGPTPKEFKKVVDEMKEDELVEEVESEYFSYPQTKYLPRKQPDLEHISGRGLRVIGNVLDQLSDMTASQISEYSHNDVPWQVTKEGENIDYEMVFYRTPDYSVREYEGETDDELG